MVFGLPELLIVLAVVAILANWYRGRHVYVRLFRQLRRLFDPKSKW
jgi:prepilin-type N-terminal cleavage/methylation domain-containing protein